MPSISYRNSNRDTVVLVHGLAASPVMMSLLAKRLSLHGYETLNLRYRSIRGKIEKHAKRLSELLASLDCDPTINKVHLLAHSMGAIITRSVLANNEFGKVERVVMLGPPHAGSPVAAKLSRVLGWLCPPLHQLSDAANSFVNQLPESMPYEVGIIAAARDRVVPIDNTHLANQTDHMVAESSHNGLLFQRPVFDQVKQFLQHGCFSKAVKCEIKDNTSRTKQKPTSVNSPTVGDVARSHSPLPTV